MRGLATVEALMAVMGDMQVLAGFPFGMEQTGDLQALVMELKNLVEQCLASERAVQVGLCGWERREC